jgi:CrcB protein
MDKITKFFAIFVPMFKDFLIVGLGSFLGGGLRYIVSRLLPVAAGFPLGTFTVNVVGCFLIGLLYGLKWDGGWMSPNTRLLLTAGFCGGFTTFSTFINECGTLVKDGNMLMPALYLLASLAVGFIALLLGNWLSQAIIK